MQEIGFTGYVSTKPSFEWGDFFCLVVVLFVLFPWIALVIEAILWFFGVPPLFGFDTARVAVAVIWPMAWTGVFALFN